MIKKITKVEDIRPIALDIKKLFSKEHDEYGHALGLKHDLDLIVKSLSHEALLNWSIHCWAHHNGDMWDGIFVSFVRKSEKFHKKIMEEYLWLSKNSISGFALLDIAQKYAKEIGCEYMFMNVVENTPLSPRLKKIYETIGFVKDVEVFIKKIN